MLSPARRTHSGSHRCPLLWGHLLCGRSRGGPHPKVSRGWGFGHRHGRRLRPCGSLWGGVGAAPRVNDKRVDESTGQRKRFSSAILPAWSRKSPRVAEVLPLLYLHGLSTSGFGPALTQFLGSGAGLSAATITRLTTQWQQEAHISYDDETPT